MKTSNYITISYLIFLFGGVLLLFLSTTYAPKYSADADLLTQEKPLSEFSVVVTEPGTNVYLKYGKNPTISLDYKKGETITFPSFAVQNDTLFIHSNSGKEKLKKVQISCKRIKAIYGEEANLWLEETIKTDTLLISLKKSEFQWSSDLINNYHLVVSVIADQSNISIGDFNVEKLDIQLNNSIMKAGNYSFGTISGNLKNGSVFTIGRFKKISLECDSISNYEMKN